MTDKIFYAVMTVLGVAVCIACIGVFQQHVTCAPVCESKEMRCAGTSVPPWGDDMVCLCEPAYVPVSVQP